MGGAVSKDFIENGTRTTVAKELDELGGYDRPALAKNQSFTARLDWLGTQVGKTSEQLQAALSKDDQAGRRELEKEAKRRQLMALRRGQGDLQMNAQYVNFFLKQRQYERGASSILRNAPFAAEVAFDAADTPSSRTTEQISTLQRIYSRRDPSRAGSKLVAADGAGAAGGDDSIAAARGGATGNGRWRQRVQQAKQTAYVAVGAYLAMNGKKKGFGPGPIDSFGLFAEQQLGEGVHKFIEEGHKVALAREKLPNMKAELEYLRNEMAVLAADQQAIEATCGGEEGPDNVCGPAEAAQEGHCENDGIDAAEAAAVATAAAAVMRHPRQKVVSQPRWHYASPSDGFAQNKARAARPVRDTPSAPATPIASPSVPTSAPVSAPLPSVGPTPPASSPRTFTTARRRGAARTTNSAGISTSLNSSPQMLAGGQAAAIGSLASGVGPRTASRASWSGAPSIPDVAGSLSGDPLLVPVGQHGSPLRPSRPSAPGTLRVSATFRCATDNGMAPGPSPSPGRSLLGQARVPSGTGSPSSVGGPRGSMLRGGDSPRGDVDDPRVGRPATPGEHRVGTMALRIASKVALPARSAAKHQLRALRDAETANVLRQQQLLQAIEENSAILQTSSGLLNMYCNRANGRWVEVQQWSLPYVHEAALPAVRRQAERYKEVVLKDLREGRLAIQIHVDDDVFYSTRLGPVPLWSVDPWQLLMLTHPARTEWTGHLIGLGLGVRQLLALATAVESLAGPEALARMPVVVSCHEGQVDAVVRDLSARKLCRFSPENVIISVQQRAHGHVFDRAKHSFVPVPEAPLRPAGSGYALLSLGWAAGMDTFRLDGPDLTERKPMERSTLDMFTERDVQWMASWRLRDLVHYSPETCLNVEQIALSCALADSMDANMSMQVELTDSLQGIHRMGAGIVLGLRERVKPPPTPTNQIANVPLLRRTAAKNHAAANSSGGTSAAAAGGPRVHHPAPPDTQPHPPQTPLRHPHSAPPTGPHTAGGGGGKLGVGARGLQQDVGSRRPLTAAAPSESRAGGIGSEGGPLAACDIKWADVMTPALATGLQKLVDTAAQQSGTPPRVAVSIKRYMYHVPSLKAILTGPAIFRPSVSVGEGGYLYVTFDASDITALTTARCVAISFSRANSTAPTTDTQSNGGASSLLPPVQGPSGNGIQTAGSPSAAPGSSGGATAAPQVRISSAGAAGAGTGPSTAAALHVATAQAAASALQRGRLLTNDNDLDTLLWVMGDQDNNPAFRASVSATNTARSRVTSHAAGGIAAATGVVGTIGGPNRALQPPPQNVIVVAVADDTACPLAVRLAMGIMKPGADCLHILSIAKDPSSTAVAVAKSVAERFENMASATLGDVKSVVQVKRLSIVEDISDYAQAVRAVLLVTGSMSLAAAQGSSVVGSVALSLARDCNRPILIVKPNARLCETAYEVGKKPCLRAALCAETSSRPMVRYVVDHILDGVRGDKLVLIRGKAFDKDMTELSSGRRILDHLAEEAVNNRRFESSAVVRRMVPGTFDAECQRVADADQCHILGVQVPDCRGPLPSNVTTLLRSSRSAVLVYRSLPNRTAPGQQPLHPQSDD